MQLFPLSLNQRNIWDVERAIPGTSINAISTTVRITGRVDFLLLQKTVDLMLEKDASLRTRIVLENGEPLQYHAPYVSEQIPVFDFSMTDESSVEYWANSLTREPMPLLDAPLYRFIFFRVDEHTAGVLIKTHHLISDGWTQALLVNRLGQIYLDLLAGKNPQLEDLPDYADYLVAEDKYLSSPAYGRDSEFWREHLNKAQEKASLKSIKSAAISPIGRRKTYRLPQVLAHAIDSYCKEKRLAPFTVFYMALSIYLKRIGGQGHSTIGVPVYNRINYAFKQTTGMFVSTLPFAGELDDSWSFEQFSKILSDRWLDVLRHQRFPYSHMLNLTENDGSLFHIVFSYQNSKILESPDASVFFSGRWFYGGYQSEHLCIHLTNIDGDCKYDVDYDYLTQIFSDQEINKLHGYICRILTSALAAPCQPICELPLLGVAEQEQVLYSFNQTMRPIRERGLYKAFLHNVQRWPHRAALIMDGCRTTYAMLCEQGNRIAAALPEAGELVAVLLPRSPLLYAAMVGIMQAGCSWLLLSPDLPEQRIKEILRQSSAARVISRREYVETLNGLELPLTDVEQLPLPTTEIRPMEPQERAYVVYTSGSTGRPKGVQISVRNLLNLAQAMQPLYDTGGAVLSLADVGFDVFVLESAAALLNAQTIILPHEDELESPAALAALIKNFRAGFLAVTPSRLLALMHEPLFISALATLKSIVCGGEAFPPELAQRLSQCTNARIYNQYGPSETTVAVSYQLVNEARVITIGKPMDNCRLYVLDDHMDPLPVGVYGELCVGGLCVGMGYLNDSDQTADKFIPSPFELGDTLYRTGDLACWTTQGEIMLAGRVDRQIKLRGLRIEPQEIASCLASYPGVTAAATRVWQQNGQAILVGYYTSSQPLSETAMLEFAASYLPRYMIPMRVLRLDSMPLSLSGKVDESQLPPPPAECTVGGVPDDVQQKVLEVFRRVLCRQEMQAGDDYFLWGGNSLNAMETVAALEDLFGVRLRIATLYGCRNAYQLGEYLRSGKHDAVPILRPAGKRDYYPLTPVQRGIYFDCCLRPEGLSYHMPGAFRAAEKWDEVRLNTAFRQMIDTDDILRTSFAPQGNSVVAFVADQVDFCLERIEADTPEEAFAAFVRPFDLKKAPLLRAALYRDANDEELLLLDVHHLICDGFSTPLLLARLDALYHGGLVTVPISFNDYACYFETQPDTVDDYWLHQLAGLPPLAALPAELPRTEQSAQQGAVYEFMLSDEQNRQLDAFCSIHGLTPFMVFVGAYGVLLAHLMQTRDLTLATPVSGRSMPGLEQVCGPLINTLPLRLHPEGPAADYLNAVKESTLGLLDHQTTPLDTIISQLGLPREAGKNPLYNAMFSLRPLDAAQFSFGGAPLEYIQAPQCAVKTDLSLEAWHSQDGYRLSFAYADIFTSSAIELYARSYLTILDQLLKDEDVAIEDMNVFSTRDRMTYIDRPSRSYAPYCDIPVNQLVAEAAWNNPEKAAVIWHDQTMTFNELMERTAQLAGVLHAHDVQPGDRIGLCCRRSPDMLASLLAILRIGAAYVPFLPSYPASRIAYMLDNAGVKLTLADAQSAAELDNLPVTLILTDEHAAPVYDDAFLQGEDTIYILYTSGSTGCPKGVQLPHRAISNLLESMRVLLDSHSGPVLCATNITFDIFISESLLALAQGLTVVLADEEEMLLPWRLADLIEKYNINITQFTPSRLQLCLNNTAFARAARLIEFVILVGEGVPLQLVNKFKQLSKGRFVNMYGPTEAAVYVTAGELSADEPVHIGRPLRNCRVYILDERLRPLLPTVSGELYLAGECLADGYINNAEQTAAMFLPDPFFPGRRMYRSGDRGRLRSNLQIECGGRVDSQIKVNGNRVELCEIIGALTAAGAVEAAVIPEQNSAGAVSLTAFVAPETLNVDELRESLRRTLPEYMMPSRLIMRPELPHNASGKLDLPLLKSLADDETQILASTSSIILTEESEDTEAIAKKEAILKEDVSVKQENIENQAYISQPVVSVDNVCELWQMVLGRTIDPADSFFVQGGTSFAALNVLSEYFNRGWEITLEQFYQHPTAVEQAKLLTEAVCDNVTEGKMSAEKEKPAEIFLPTSGRIETVYSARVPNPISDLALEQKIVLLTGATGFFGAHLLRKLAEQGTSQFVCLLRGGDRKRLLDALSWYFGQGWVADHEQRLRVITGDISLSRLGLDKAAYDRLISEIDTIYHCAADVRHYLPSEEADSVNLTGTRRIVELADQAGAVLYHMSTVSIAADHLIGQPQAHAVFTEYDFDLGQNWRDNEYLKTKFLAENEIYTAVNQGLPARIYRLGRLVGRSSDGVFQREPDNNMFYQLVRSTALLGAIPQSLANACPDMTAVDVAADAVVALRDTLLTTSHIMAPQPLPLSQALTLLMPQLEILPDSQFADLIAKRSAQYGQQLAPLINLWNSRKGFVEMISISTAATQDELRQRDFIWPPPDPARELAAFTRYLNVEG